MNKFISEVDSFFIEYPGYRAIFIEIIAKIPEFDEVNDAQLIETIVSILPKLNSSLTSEDCEAIAFVLIKAVGNLLWLSLGQSPDCHQLLVMETQRLSFSYLQTYVPQQKISKFQTSDFMASYGIVSHDDFAEKSLCCLSLTFFLL